MNDRTSPIPKPESGLEAFAALLRSTIPDYGTRGALQKWLDYRGIATEMQSSELGRYARGEVEPKTDRLRVLARGMNIPLEYVRGVLEGVVPPSDMTPLAGEDAIEAMALLERVMQIVQRMTILHAQSYRAKLPRPGRKKGRPIQTRMHSIGTRGHVSSTSS